MAEARILKEIALNEFQIFSLEDNATCNNNTFCTPFVFFCFSVTTESGLLSPTEFVNKQINNKHTSQSPHMHSA